MRPQVLPLIVSALSTALGFATLTLAQGLPEPKQFYNQGYVNDPRASPAPDATPTPREAALQDPSSSLADPAVGTQAPEETPASKETPIVSEYAEGEGEKPRAVSLLLSTADAELLKKHYRELVQLSEKSGFKLKDLFLVGDPKSLPSKGLFSELTKGGSKMVLRFVPRIPKEFGEIKSSPALLVETSTGVVVVEGYPSLGKVFSADGRFIEPTAETVR